MTGSFYLFLAEKGLTDTNRIIEAMDINKDKYVMKSEFQTWVKKNANNQFTNGEIDDFFREFDKKQTGNVAGTNIKELNCLNNNEMSLMAKKAEAYKVLMDFINAKGIGDFSLGGRISNAQGCKKSFIESIQNTFERAINTNQDLEQVLANNAPKAYAKTIADYYSLDYFKKKIYQNSVLRGSGYQMDDAFNADRNAFIRAISPSLDADEIASYVEEMIDDYFDTLNDTSSNERMNGIQLAYVTAQLKNKLSADMRHFNNLKNNEYEEALAEFLSGKKYSDCTNIDALSAEFKNSGLYTSLKVLNTFLDVNASTSVMFNNKNVKFKDMLAEKIAAKLNSADKSTINKIVNHVLNDDIYLDKYKEFVTQAAFMVRYNSFNSLDDALYNAMDKITDLIVLNLGDFIATSPESNSNMDYNTLYNNYINDKTRALGLFDANESMNAFRKAAIDYIKAVLSKDDRIPPLVNNIFGADYEDFINNHTPSIIDRKIAQLKNAIDNLPPISNQTNNPNGPIHITGDPTNPTGDGDKPKLPTVDDMLSKLSFRGIQKIVNGRGADNNALSDFSNSMHGKINNIANELAKDHSIDRTYIEKAKGTLINYYDAIGNTMVNKSKELKYNSTSNVLQHESVATPSFYNSITGKDDTLTDTVSYFYSRDNEDVNFDNGTTLQNQRYSSSGVYWAIDADWIGNDNHYVYIDMKVVVQKFLNYVACQYN